MRLAGAETGTSGCRPVFLVMATAAGPSRSTSALGKHRRCAVAELVAMVARKLGSFDVACSA